MRSRVLLLFLLTVCFLSCSQEKDNPQNASSFDRQALMAHTADSLIIPAFQTWAQSAQKLKAAAELFDENPNDVNLTNLQRSWQDLITDWQFAAPYNIGPASLPTGALSLEVATFPANVEAIEGFITQKDFSLNNFQRDARGQFALEYLMFSERKSELLTAANRRQYLLALVAHIERLAKQVSTEWQSYRNTFVASNGTDAGSSLTALFNTFNAHYEALKNFKIGLPLGLRAGQNQTEPTRVEAYYSSLSTQLARQHFTVTTNLYRGTSRNGTTGPSFREYARSAVGGEELVAQTEDQILKVEAAFASLPNLPLPQQIAEQRSEPVALHTELQKLTRFFKSELTSRLGLSITYSSNDGD